MSQGADSYLLLGKVVTKIRGNSAREVVGANTILKVYRRACPYAENISFGSKILIYYKQSLEIRSADFTLSILAPQDGLELPAKR